MLRKFKFLVVGLAAVFVLTGGKVAAASSGGFVSGHLYENGTPVSGVQVTVDCNDVNGSSFEHHPDTSNTGYYSTQFSEGDCVSGAHVTVTATSGSASGTASGTMGDSLDLTNMDFSLVAVALPEFTPWAMATIVPLAGLVIWQVRKRTV